MMKMTLKLQVVGSSNSEFGVIPSSSDSESEPDLAK